MAVNLTAEQRNNAAIIADVGRKMGASQRDIATAIATAMQESSLRNLKYGDRDSQGLFQQRPSQGWGTVAQVTNPQYAATKFYQKLFTIKNRGSMSLTQAAQAVQVSAFPNAYAQWEGMANSLAGVKGGTMQVSNAGGGTTLAPSTSLDAKQLAQRYGYSMVFFNGNKELSGLIGQAVTGQWTPEEFGARLRNTKWYKTYSSSYREWYALEHTDGATAIARKSATITQLQAQANKLGIKIDSKRLTDMAWRVNAYGWTPDQVNVALAAEMHYDPKQGLVGDTAAMESAIKQQAAAYGITLSAQDTYGYVQKIVAGRMTQDGVVEYLKKMAKSKYPGIADDIEKGMTVMDYAAPYIQSQARLLEIEPADVHLDDPLLAKALQFRDPKTGAAGAPMSLFDYETSIKSDPRWMKTKNARDDLMTGAHKVLTDWGLA